MSITVTSIGAARTVTGSRHLVRTSTATILLDCGFFQGRRSESRERNKNLGLGDTKIDAVVLSHAHIDHSGALPVLCKKGFTGPIYATPATRDLCVVMLEDAAMIQESDARYLNRAIEKNHVDAEPISPLYDQADVERAIEQFLTLPYHRPLSIAPGVSLTFLDAGHVLGSAIVVLDIDDAGEKHRLVFTGDLGRTNAPILRDPEVPPGTSTLILESTYGDRLHDTLASTEDHLAEAINQTYKRGGKVVIPSFALERAQEIILALKLLRESNRIPSMPVYVDSPMTVHVTDVFRLHPDCYDEETRHLLLEDSSPFEFDELKYVSTPEASRAIDASPEPCVIISASGMCEAGRVLHHLQNIIGNPKNTVIIVGFQAQHTLGRRLVERSPRVKIFGVEREVYAEVITLNGFSAHADQSELLAFAEETRKQGTLRTVLLVHGEDKATETLKGLLEARGFSDVRVPSAGVTQSV